MLFPAATKGSAGSGTFYARPNLLGIHCARGVCMMLAGACCMESSAPIVRMGESMCVKNFL